MKDEDDKDLDRLFKDRLQDSENLFAYNEEDWLALEAKMDKKDNRRAAIYWLRIGSGIAAILLLCFAWWFLTDTVPAPQTSASNKTKKEQKKTPIDVASPPVTPISVSPTPASTASHIVKPVKAVPSPNLNQVPVRQYQVYTPITNRKTDQQPQQAQWVSPVDTNKTVIANATVPVVNQETNAVQLVAIVPNQEEPTVQTPTAEHTIIAQPIVKKSKKQPITFAVSVIAASDLNGISALKQTEVGANYGALVNVGISKRITLQTGLIYSDKPYRSNNDSYTATYTSPYAAKYTPTSVFVSCKMFDVPINIDYLAFENKSNKISFGTGLSSYFMLHENYQYNFDPAIHYATKNYEVPNSKSYLFSILNLSATYERKLSNRFGLTAQPYLKVPLRAVGYGNIKLQSVGFSFGLKMNFNKSGKGR